MSKVIAPCTSSCRFFDNGFHMSLPKYTYIYGIPYEYYEKYKIRRYGFHGIAFRSMAEEVDRILNDSHKNYKIVKLDVRKRHHCQRFEVR